MAGIYQFFPYIRSTPKANFRLSVDGSVYINPKQNYDSESTEGEAEGALAIVRLQAGQTVCVSTGDLNYTVIGSTGGTSTWFGGYLIFPDTE